MKQKCFSSVRRWSDRCVIFWTLSLSLCVCQSQPADQHRSQVSGLGGLHCGPRAWRHLSVSRRVCGRGSPGPPLQVVPVQTNEGWMEDQRLPGPLSHPGGTPKPLTEHMTADYGTTYWWTGRGCVRACVCVCAGSGSLRCQRHRKMHHGHRVHRHHHQKWSSQSQREAVWVTGNTHMYELTKWWNIKRAEESPEQSPEVPHIPENLGVTLSKKHTVFCQTGGI